MAHADKIPIIWNNKYGNISKTNTVKIRSRVYEATNMYRKITRSKKCNSKKNNIRNNIRATYAKSCRNNETNASCKVTKIKKYNDAKNNKNSIIPSYVKYSNSRKGIYIKKPYTNIHSKYINHGKRYRLQRCERYVYKKPVLRKADTHTHTHTHTHSQTYGQVYSQ